MKLDRRVASAIGAGVVVLGVFVGTALAGRGDAVERETLVRARVWCEALVERDALRYQETFRRDYFAGEFDRFANAYREPTEASILAAMPRTSSCRAVRAPTEPGPRGDVYVAIERVDPDGRRHRQNLRMRQQAGFWVVYRIEPRIES